MLCSVYCHDLYYFMIQVISSSCFLCLFSMNAWVGWFLMNDFQAFLFFSQVLPGFPYFQITSDYLFHVFTGRSLGNIAQASKVPHLLDQAFCSIILFHSVQITKPLQSSFLYLFPHAFQFQTCPKFFSRNPMHKSNITPPCKHPCIIRLQSRPGIVSISCPLYLIHR